MNDNNFSQPKVWQKAHLLINTLPMSNSDNRNLFNGNIHSVRDTVWPGPNRIEAGKLALKPFRSNEGVSRHALYNFVNFLFIRVWKSAISFISFFGETYFEHRRAVYKFFGHETVFLAAISASPLRIDDISSLLAKISRVSSHPSSSSILTRAAFALPFLVMITRDLASSTSSSNSFNLVLSSVEGTVVVDMTQNIHNYVKNVKETELKVDAELSLLRAALRKNLTKRDIKSDVFDSDLSEELSTYTSDLNFSSSASRCH